LSELYSFQSPPLQFSPPISSFAARNLGKVPHSSYFSENITCAPSLYVLPCFHIKKLDQKVYEKINKKYEWIVHIIFYQPTKF
jgi:hypothetical protein